MEAMTAQAAHGKPLVGPQPTVESQNYDTLCVKLFFSNDDGRSVASLHLSALSNFYRRSLAGWDRHTKPALSQLAFLWGTFAVDMLIQLCLVCRYFVYFYRNFGAQKHTLFTRVA
jgi:hypothetical protein